MVDKGWSEPVIPTYFNGLHHLPAMALRDMSQEQQEKFQEDEPQCFMSEIFGVQNIYEMQIGNPQLYADENVAVVDCLHKSGAVPESYTLEQWRKELAEARKKHGNARSEPFSINVEEPQIKSCLIANGFTDLGTRDYWEVTPLTSSTSATTAQ